jgi:hypothetical protein
MTKSQARCNAEQFKHPSYRPDEKAAKVRQFLTLTKRMSRGDPHLLSNQPLGNRPRLHNQRRPPNGTSSALRKKEARSSFK